MRGHERGISFKPEAEVREEQIPLEFATEPLHQDTLLRVLGVLESLTHPW